MSGKNTAASEIEALQKKTVEIEQEREAKKRERLLKKKEQELKRRREVQARLIAPILLVMTILISVLLGLIF